MYWFTTLYKIRFVLPLLFSSITYCLSAQDAFISTWQTDSLGVSNSSSITIPINTDRDYLYDVDWNNDGVYDEFQITNSITHDFGVPGSYTIRIRGIFPHIYFNNTGDKEKLIDIVQWGTIEWESMKGAFNGCKNLKISATDVPDLSQVNSFQQTFANCTFFNSPIGHWDVSTIESFYFTFKNCGVFNQPLNEWNVANAENMQRMFIGCTSFDQPLDSWDVSKVRSFGAMFHGCKNFNQPLASWDMSSAIHISLMFAEAEKFNQPIGNWQLDNMTNMHTMFSGAKAFNQDIGNWDVSRVSSLASVFKGAAAFNQDLNDWDVSQVTNLGWTFAGANTFNGDITGWDVSAVTNMSYTFFNAYDFNRDIGAWNVGQVTSMTHTFDKAHEFNQDISDWDVSNVVHFGSMFLRAFEFDQNLENWDVSQAENMQNMFDDIALSTENYDRLLIGWSNLSLNDSLFFDGGNSVYCTAWEARDYLKETFVWDIKDGGSNNTPPTPICKDITVELQNSVRVITAQMLDNGSSGYCTDLLFDTEKLEFTCTDIGTSEQLLKVTDMLGNEATCVSTVTVLDGPIQFNCPENKNVLVNSEDCQAVVNWDELYGNCTTSVSSTHLSGATFPLGITTVKYTAIDTVADTMNCSFTISVSSDLTVTLDNIQHPICHGDANGLIEITAVGGAGVYIYDWDTDGTGDKDDPEDLQDLSSGNYQLLLTDAFGCTTTEDITLIQPDALVLTSELNENANSSLIDLSVSGGVPGYQFDWDNDGVGDYDDPEDLAISESGVYTVVVKDENGCTSSHRHEVIINSTANPFTMQHFEISPNPNQGIFVVTLNSYTAVSELDIFDAQGKKVYTQEIRAQRTTLKLSELPSGTYFLRLNNRNGTIVRPMIIRRDD